MLIQCTKALLDKIGTKGNELASPEGHEQFPYSFFAWHANFVNINRRKAIILMNNETRYSLVIFRPSGKDFSKIKELICEAIPEALRMVGVRKDVVEAYMAQAGAISFSKTAGKSMLGKMNNAIREIELMWEYLDEKTRIQRYISIATGRFIQMSGPNKAFYPFEKMLKCLGIVYGLDENSAVEDVLDIDLYQLKIQMNLDGHDIWRRVFVPSTYSFRHLHFIIQTVFDWQNCHLHEFVVDREENKPLKIVMDDNPETMEYVNLDEFETRQERFIAVEDIFPEHGEVIYEYDFGDSWEHIITLEKVVKSNVFQATYLEGNGERPPEDVGGVWGFEEYLRVIKNEKDPGHDDMIAWAENQKERMQSSDEVNQRLKRVIRGNGFSTFVK
jgi:hypothetical protein